MMDLLDDKQIDAVLRAIDAIEELEFYHVPDVRLSVDLSRALKGLKKMLEEEE